MKQVVTEYDFMVTRHIALLIGMVCLAFVVACATADSTGDKIEIQTTWDGVYTQEQAQRGQKLVEAHCAICHGKNLFGSRAAPAIAGSEMLFIWDGRTLIELLETMRTSMPPGQVGIVTDQEFVDVIATMLGSSGFPSREEGDLSALGTELEHTVFKREKPE